MGSRNRFNTRTKKKEDEKKKPYSTRAGRGSNRVPVKTELKNIPASKRPADMRKGVTYGDSGKKKPSKSYTVSGVSYDRNSGQAIAKKDNGKAYISSNGYSIDPKTGKRTGIKAPSKPKPKPSPKPSSKPTKKPAATKPTAPAKKKPTYNKPSTTKGPTKSGNYIASKGSSTKGGPTADGKTYKNQIKSKRLRDALNNLKVRKYKK